MPANSPFSQILCVHYAESTEALKRVTALAVACLPSGKSVTITDKTVRDAIVEALNKKFENEFHILGERADGCIVFAADRKEFTITVQLTKLYSAALIGGPERS